MWYTHFPLERHTTRAHFSNRVYSESIGPWRNTWIKLWCSRSHKGATELKTDPYQTLKIWFCSLPAVGNWIFLFSNLWKNFLKFQLCAQYETLKYRRATATVVYYPQRTIVKLSWLLSNTFSTLAFVTVIFRLSIRFLKPHCISILVT